MPRIRSIKPEFFASEDVSVLPLRARLTWIGLWTQCDDHGRTKHNAKLIKAAIWPLDDVSLRDVEEDLQALVDAGRIVTYVVDSTPLLAVVNWHVHQSINKPSKARHPGPPAPLGVKDPNDPAFCRYCSVPGPAELLEPSGSPPGALPLGGEGRGKEGRGRAREAAPNPPGADPEPPSRCPKHLTSRNPPSCGPCADARKDHSRWEARRAARIDALPKCRIHPHEPAEHCGPCRSEELSPA